MHRPHLRDSPPMPANFALIGEHRADPDRLLLLGDDGRCYAYHLPAGPFAPVEPEEEEWAVDPDLPLAEDLFA